MAMAKIFWPEIRTREKELHLPVTTTKKKELPAAETTAERKELHLPATHDHDRTEKLWRSWVGDRRWNRC